MWCGTVDYNDISEILLRHKFVKSKEVCSREWFLRNVGDKNLTIRIISSHWCGVHYHNIEVYDTNNKHYSWLQKNDGEYKELLNETLPSLSIKSLEERLCEILIMYKANVFEENYEIKKPTKELIEDTLNLKLPDPEEELNLLFLR